VPSASPVDGTTDQLLPLRVELNVRTGEPDGLVPLNTVTVTVDESPGAEPADPLSGGDEVLTVLPFRGWASVGAGATVSTVNVDAPLEPVLPAASACSARAV